MAALDPISQAFIKFFAGMLVFSGGILMIGLIVLLIVLCLTIVYPKCKLFSNKDNFTDFIKTTLLSLIPLVNIAVALTIVGLIFQKAIEQTGNNISKFMHNRYLKCKGK